MTQPENDERVLHATPDEPEAILVAVDASSGVERIINMAVRLGRAMPDSTIHVLHVFKSSRLDRHERAPRHRRRATPSKTPRST